MRVLVERLWPRGLGKKRAAVDVWMKDVAPSPEARRHCAQADLGHDQRRYDPEILQRRPHRGRGVQRQQRIVRRQFAVGVITAVLDGEVTVQRAFVVADGDREPPFVFMD